MSKAKLFNLEIATWENDGDHDSTQVIAGLSAEDAAFYKALAERFTSHSNRGKPGMGNEEHSHDVYNDLILEMLDEHPNISVEVREEWQDAVDADDVYSSLAETILGYPVEYEWMFARVVERVDVIEIYHPIDGITRNWVSNYPQQAVEMIQQLTDEVERLKKELNNGNE